LSGREAGPSSGGFRWTLGLAWVVVLGLSAPGVATAQGTGPGQLQANAVSVSIGLFRPADSVFRGVYGSGQVAISVQASHRWWRGLSVFGGVRYARADGHTQAIDRSDAGEAYTVRLSTWTGRAGVLVAIQRAHWVFELGGGGTIGRYTESWPGAPAPAAVASAGEVRTTRGGALVQLGASRALSPRLAVVGRVEYSLVAHAPAWQAGATVPRNLGGVDGTIGLLLRF
jgi:hypothetical protein